MDKDTFRRLLQKQASGKLSEEEEVLLRQAYDQLFNEEIAAGTEDLKSGPDEQRGRIILQKIYGRIKPRSKFPVNFRVFMKAAAVVVLTLSSALAYYYRFDILDKIDPIEQQTFAAGNDAAGMLALEDGSVVWLNKNSSIVYPSRFRGPRRKIRLRGEAYFQVARDKKRPFLVKSGSLDVRVLGTSFVVSDAVESSNKEVTVLTGKVNVSAGKRQLGILEPNQQVIYNSDSKQSSRRQVDAGRTIAFTKEELEFRDTPLSQVLPALETRYGVRMYFKGADVRGKNFSGIIKKEDKLEDLLEILTATLNFNYKINNDSTITITP